MSGLYVIRSGCSLVKTGYLPTLHHTCPSACCCHLVISCRLFVRSKNKETETLSYIFVASIFFLFFFYFSILETLSLIWERLALPTRISTPGNRTENTTRRKEPICSVHLTDHCGFLLLLLVNVSRSPSRPVLLVANHQWKIP